MRPLSLRSLSLRSLSLRSLSGRTPGVRALPLFVALISSAGCDRLLEIEDRAVLEVDTLLPFAPADLPAEALPTLQARIAAEGAASGTLIIGDETSEARVFGTFPLEVAETTTLDVTLDLVGARSLSRPPSLLARYQTTVEVTPGLPVQVTPTAADFVLEGGFAFDDNENETSNLDDLLRGCDPAPPLAFLAVSATDLQFAPPPGGTAPRQFVLIDNVSDLPIEVTGLVVDAFGVDVTVFESGVPPLPTVEGGFLDPGDELLLTATFNPPGPYLTTGALIVEGTDACGVTRSSAVRLIGNVDADPQPAPEGYEPPAPPGEGLSPWPADNLFGGLPVDDRSGGPDSPGALGELWSVGLPAGYGLEVLLVDLEERVDLRVEELDPGPGSESPWTSTRDGLSPELVQIPPAPADRVLHVSLVPADGGPEDVRGLGTLSMHAVSAPRIQSIDPRGGPLEGGTEVTLLGQGFRAGARVTVGGTDGTAVVVSTDGDRVTFRTPAASPDVAGQPLAVHLEQTGLGGWVESATVPSAFAYDPGPPRLDAVTPSRVSSDGTTSVTLVGSGFVAVPRVLFGTLPATDVAYLSSSLLTATVPAQPAGVLDVTVVNLLAGGEEAPFTLPGGVEVVSPTGPAPTVTGALVPDSGPVGGGTSVALAGTGFSSGLAVRFGDRPALSVAVTSDSAATAVSPAAAGPGPVTVRVTGFDNPATVEAGTFTYQAAPTGISLIDVFPDQVHAGFTGEALSVFGTGLDGLAAPTARIVGPDLTSYAAAVGALSATSATVLVGAPLPAAAGYTVVLEEGALSATSPPFTASEPVAFEVVSVPALPAEVDGFDVFVSGVLLHPTRVAGVRFDRGDGAPVTLDAATASESLLQVVVQPGELLQGTHAVAVVYDDGQSLAAFGTLEVTGECGNGIREALEACDGSDLPTPACTDVAGAGWASGAVTCSPFCTLDTSSCTRCGNGTLDPGEACDGAAFLHAGCAELAGYSAGALACQGDCTYDVSGCSLCGDATAGPGEDCDGVDLRGETCDSLTSGLLPSGAPACQQCMFDLDGCYQCGDGICSAAELDGGLCPGDCVGCGDDTCDTGGGETCSSCSADCGQCQPYALTVVSPLSSSGVVTTLLPQVLRVRVTDEMGLPLPGVLITTTVTQGGYAVNPSDLTDATGEMTTGVVVGPLAGPQVVTVTATAPDHTPILGSPLVLALEAETVPDGYSLTFANLDHIPDSGFGSPPVGASILLADVNGPEHVAVAPDGSVAVTSYYSRVLVFQDGVYTWGVGTAPGPGLGDYGPAENAQLSGVRHLQFDPLGRLYILDPGHQSIRRVGTDGIIVTVAGGGVVRGAAAQGIDPLDLDLGFLSAMRVDDAGERLAIWGEDGVLYLVDLVADSVEVLNASVYYTCATTGFTANFLSASDLIWIDDDNLGLGGGFNGTPCADFSGSALHRFSLSDGLAVIYPTNVPGHYFAGPVNGWIVHTNLYAHEVARTSQYGLTTTLLGTGTYADGVDPAPGPTVALNTPRGLAIGADGQVFVADSSNHAVRELPRAIPANQPVVTLSVVGGDGQSRIPARPLVAPVRFRVEIDGVPTPGQSIALEDNTGLVGMSPAVVTTGVDGEAQSQLWAPLIPGTWEVTARLEGLLASVETTLTVTSVTPQAGQFVTYVNHTGGFGNQSPPLPFAPFSRLNLGPTSAQYGNQLAVASDGAITLGEDSRHRVLELDLMNGLSILGGTGTQGFSGDGGAFASAQLAALGGLTRRSDDRLLVVDRGNDRVRQVDASGVVQTFAGGAIDTTGHGDGLLATNAYFNDPVDVAEASDGTVYVVDRAYCLLRAIDPGTSIIRTALQGVDVNTCGSSSGPNRIYALYGVAAGADAVGDPVVYFVGALGYNLSDIGVYRLDAEGVRGGSAVTTRLLLTSAVPRLVHFDSARQELFVVENDTLHHLDAAGNVLHTWGGGSGYLAEGWVEDPPPGENGPIQFDEIVGLTTDGEGTLWVLEYGSHTLRRIWLP